MIMVVEYQLYNFIAGKASWVILSQTHLTEVVVVGEVGGGRSIVCFTTLSYL